MHRLQTFYCDKIPRELEVQAAVDLAQAEDCYVEIKWYVPHNGNHSVIITDRDDYESAAEKLPKRYPV